MSDQLSFIPALNIGASGLDAQSRRMEVIAGNVANADATRGPDGRPFQRREVVFSTKLREAAQRARRPGGDLAGVRIERVTKDETPFEKVYRPGHPHANADGYIEKPNVNVVEEMVDMMRASRAYEANLASMHTATQMAQQALRILQ